MVFILKLAIISLKLIYTNYWAKLANFIGIFRLLFFKFDHFLPRKYFYRATFESCDLEIGHLAAVIEEYWCNYQHSFFCNFSYNNVHTLRTVSLGGYPTDLGL